MDPVESLTSETLRPPYASGAARGRRNWGLYAIAALTVLAGVLGREAVVELFQPAAATLPAAQVRLPPVPKAPTGPSIAILRQQALRRTEPSLAWADAQTRAAVGPHVDAIDEFFADVKSRTPVFSKKILGWSSKWRLVSDKLPLTRDDRHAQFLTRTFNEQLFSSADLTQVIDQIIRNYADGVAAVENEMLVRMRADVGDLPPTVLPEFVDQATLDAAFARAMAEASERVNADLKADVTREAVSLVVGEVLAIAAVRLGVSGGILAAGATSSWATVGIGLVVAVIVDQIVSWAWDKWRDPAGDISRKMDDKLEEIRRLIVEGDGENPGLRERLIALSYERAKLRQAAIAELFAPPAEGKQP